MIRAVLSDWGHTLFGTTGTPAFMARWVSRHGVSVDPVRLGHLYDEAFARSRTPAELAKGRDLSPAAHRRCWLALWAELDALAPGLAEALYEFETSAQGWMPYSDTRAFMETLAARSIPLVVVSDVPFDLRPIFAAYELDHLVSGYVLSGEHASVKSQGHLFDLALEVAGCRAEEALMIGDNPANDGCAVYRGITTVLLALVAPGQPRGLLETVRPLLG
jgi:FMN phosphatase YigB (HAD superfamily)